MMLSRSAMLIPLHRIHTFSHILLGFINSSLFRVNVLSLLLWFFSIFLYSTCPCLPLHYPFAFSLASMYCVWVGAFFFSFYFFFSFLLSCGLKILHSLHICILNYLRDHPPSCNPVLCCKIIFFSSVHHVIACMIPMWKLFPIPHNFWFSFPAIFQDEGKRRIVIDGL